MGKIQNSLDRISTFQVFSRQKSAVHSLHPAVKITALIIYISCVVSFNRHTVLAMLPFVLYQVILSTLAGIPLLFLLKRSLIALPFCFFAGLGNIYFERETAAVIFQIHFSAGFFSLISLCLRSLLCVSAVLLFAAVTKLRDIAAQLRRFRVPAILVLLLEMTMRFTGILLPEAALMRRSYILRGGGKKGIDIKHFGSFTGSFFLRTIERGESVYQAMKCRAYSLDAIRNLKFSRAPKLSAADMVFLLFSGGLSFLFRLYDIPLYFGTLIFK